jgi:hypothetical protein
MPDALQLILDILRRHDIAIGECRKSSFTPLETPFQRHFIDGQRAFGLAAGRIHRGVEMIGRVQMRARMGGQPHPFGGGKTGPVGGLLGGDAGKEMAQFGKVSLCT